MSTLAIEERFTVNAPLARVWSYLIEPEKVVVCLPGAELLEVENERTYHGQMKIKVGPVTVAYTGKVDLTEVDESGRRIQMIGSGKEKGGAGSARMTMNSHLVALDSGATEVVVAADVQLAGRIVRFGRGMIQGVSSQMFKQFAENLRELIESAPVDDKTLRKEGTPERPDQQTLRKEGTPERPEDHSVSTAAAAQAGASGQDSGQDSAGAETDSAGTAPPRESAAAAVNEARPRDDAEATTDSAAARPAAPPDASEPEDRESQSAAPSDRTTAGKDEGKAASPPGTMRQIARREAEPVRILPLIFRAMWSSIVGFFRRIFGRSDEAGK